MNILEYILKSENEKITIKKMKAKKVPYGWIGNKEQLLRLLPRYVLKTKKYKIIDDVIILENY
jgi:hypothetical protein